MEVVLKFTHFFLFLLELFLLSLHGEGIDAGLVVLGLDLLEPVVLGLDLLVRVGTPSGHPVVSDRVEHQPGSLLARRQPLLLSELLPLGLGLFPRHGFLSGDNDPGLGQLDAVLGLGVLEDAAVLSCAGALLSLKLEELLEERLEVLLGHLDDLALGLPTVVLAVLHY